MDEVLAKAEEWRAAGEQVALATVVAHAALGAAAARLEARRHARGRLFGSVSGGCVEADVAERAQAILSEDGAPASCTYGIADDEAWSVGLPCGGEIDVFVEPFAGAPPIERGTSYVVVAGEGLGERWHDDERGQTGLREEEAARCSPRRSAAAAARDRSARATSPRRCPRSRGRSAGGRWSSTRAPGLATRERIPSADELVVAWPDEIEIDAETALVSLVHEERLDLPALRAAVEGGAFYVGALGSRRAQAKRREQARRPVADRVKGPVGPRPRRRDAGRDRARDRRRDPLRAEAARARARLAERAGSGSRAGRDPGASPIIAAPATRCSQLSARLSGTQAARVGPTTPSSHSASEAMPPTMR